MSDDDMAQYWKAFNTFVMQVGAMDPVNLNPSSVAALPEETRHWLTEALTQQSKATDPVQMIKKFMKDLVDLMPSNDSQPFDEANAEDAKNALYGLTEICGFVDLAFHFYQFNGLRLLKYYAGRDHEAVKSQALELVGELAQNNPECQKAMLEAHYLPLLFSCLDGSMSDSVRRKSLYALSCMTRGFEAATQLFCESGGIERMLEQLEHPAGRTKACFILNNVFCELPHFQERACKERTLEQLVDTLLCADAYDALEQPLNLLQSLSSNSVIIKSTEEKRDMLKPKLYDLRKKLANNDDFAEIVKRLDAVLRQFCY